MLAYQFTGDAAATALVVGSRVLPGVFSPGLVAVVSRLGWDSLTAMRRADIVRALLFPLYLFVDGLLPMCILTFLIGTCRSLEVPSLYTVIGGGVNEGSRVKVNNAFGLLQNSMAVAGPVLGGIMQATFGGSFVILFNSATFVVSFAILSTLKSAKASQAEDDCRSDGEARSNSHSSFYFWRSSFDFLRTNLLIASFFLIDVASGIAFGSLNSLIPIIAQLEFSSSPILCGALQSSLMVGLLLGNVVYAGMVGRWIGVWSYFIASYFALGCFLALGFGYTSLVALPLLIVVGAGNSVQDVLLITAIQGAAQSDRDSSRFFSIRESIQSIVVFASTGLVTLEVEGIGIGPLIIILGVSSVLLVAVLHILTFREGVD